MLDETIEERCGLSVRDERLHLEDDLDDAMKNRENKIDLREPGESDALPL